MDEVGLDDSSCYSGAGDWKQDSAAGSWPEPAVSFQDAALLTYRTVYSNVDCVLSRAGVLALSDGERREVNVVGSGRYLL